MSIVQRTLAKKRARSQIDPTKIKSISKILGKKQSKETARINFNGTLEARPGGRSGTITSNSNFSIYSFYMGTNASTGEVQIIQGFRTIFLTAGSAHLSIVSKKDGSTDKTIFAGEIVNLRRGRSYVMSTTGSAAEFMVIDSEGIKEKQLSPDIDNWISTSEYFSVRNNPSRASEMKPVGGKTKAEREVLGRQFLQQRGAVSEKEKFTMNQRPEVNAAGQPKAPEEGKTLEQVMNNFVVEGDSPTPMNESEKE